jgi:hypothetical protein
MRVRVRVRVRVCVCVCVCVGFSTESPPSHLVLLQAAAVLAGPRAYQQRLRNVRCENLTCQGFRRAPGKQALLF